VLEGLFSLRRHSSLVTVVTKYLNFTTCSKDSLATIKNQNSLVDTDWGSDFTLRGSNSGKDERLFCSAKRQNLLRGPASYSPGTGVVPREEVDHSTQSNADDENEWRCTSSPPICLHGMDRNNCTSVPFYLCEAPYDFVIHSDEGM